MGGPAVSSKKRLFITLCGIGLIFILLIGRLFWIQIIQGEELSQMALDQQTQDTSLSAARGSITDSNGVVLAQSGTAYKVLINPYRLNQESNKDNLLRVVTELSSILGMEQDYVMAQTQKQNSSGVYYKEVVLKRQVEREVVDDIVSRKLGSGVYTAIDSKRYYPEGSLFSQLLGFTTVDGVGQAGLEQKFEKYLAGENGRMITETDRAGHAIAYGSQEILDPVDGCDIILTTDSVVQSFLEKALKEALEVNKAESAQGIIMNCNTGEIVAMSTQPDYNPNDPPRSDVALLNSLSRNRIVADAYEPGSTFKIVTLSAAIDSGAVTEESAFECGGSYTLANGERIKCWKSGGHGHQDLAKAVQNSCNPAFMRMALSMGNSTFYDYIYAFGFGSSTGSGLNGETAGIVTHEKYVNDNTLARIGFGQSIAVTPIQLCAAVSAAVNGGELMQPYAVDSIVSQEGRVLQKNEPTVVRRVISETTSERVRTILESVVSEGSGKNAAIPGYRVGGKTGTAQKYENGQIADGKLIASFIGFAPADDPEYVCLILVDEPKVGTIFGSTVAAPFVKQVMEETLRHYGYLPTENSSTVSVPDVAGLTIEEAKAVLKDAGLSAEYQDDPTLMVTAQVPAANEQVQKSTDVLLYTEATNIETAETSQELVTVPDVVGKTRLAANDALAGKGLTIRIEPEDQTGTAIRQVPAAGEEVPVGTEVLVEFSHIELLTDPED